MQGFKTFAKKTTVQLLDKQEGRHSITAIVGPNGSGKSNIADAIRWVLGEQSMKTLRGKSSHDVIFSGSNGKTRAGFAEVTVTFGDANKIEGVETSELAITRRLYRDGESSYLINGRSVRLLDVQMLLAQANVGQKSYSIINQGQVDHILAASPEERKNFFDDATGVKPLQLKRHKAILKINRTKNNLQQAELLVEEIAPRLRTLKRLVRRLSQREEVESELRTKQVQYYGSTWNTLQEQMKTELSLFRSQEESVGKQQKELSKEKKLFAEIEAASKETKDDEAGSKKLGELQKQYEALQEERASLRESRFELEKKLELDKAKAFSSWTPLPLSKIIEQLTGLRSSLKSLKKKLAGGKLTEADLDSAFDTSSKLLNRLQKPAPESHQPDKEALKKLDDIKKQDAGIDKKLAELKKSMHALATAAKDDKQELFALQRRMLKAQEKLHDLESGLNERRVALARIETRLEDLEREMKEQLDAGLQKESKAFKGAVDTSDLHGDIMRLRQKLELIGGIDEETVKEHDEAKERHDFLEEQIADLVQALSDTEKIVKELDEQIKEQSKASFKEIQTNFEHYFKILFKGGSATLKEIRAKDIEPKAPKKVKDAPEELEALDDEEFEEPAVKEDPNRVVGIEITATPPGKRLKNINLLSGGERALTSIALISAIMATNPSPFVVLDEVDAALDEANTVRFAEIVEELSEHTQFILVTHNRATMHAADALYGVTMQSDGVSQMISVKMEEVAKNGTARR